MALNSSSVVMKLALFSSPDTASVDSITLFVLLLCACVLIGHLLEKSRWMTESVVAIIIGLFTGTIILMTTKGRSSHILVFDEELFFIYLLPPIIFNAGFQVKKKQFFRNFLAIILYGVVGSLISFLIVSLGSLQLFKSLDLDLMGLGDYFALGAVFSATDSVCTLQVLNQEETPLLYSLVFGEGVVNDATSVVLFNAIQKFDLSHITSANVLQFIGNFFYLFLASTFLGVVVGLLSAYVIKKLYIGRHSTDREIALMILMAYMSYMLAELLDLSGILTVFFCGIVMSHYTWHNVTENSRITSRHAFATFSFVSEIFIFLYVGMDALDMEKWKYASDSPWTLFGACGILLCLVLLGRAAFVFPLSFIANLFRKSKADKIAFKQQVVIWWAGLMRGAVSIALAYNKFTRKGHTQLQGNAIMITSTITVVLLTNVVGGLLTKPLIRSLLDPHKNGGDSVASDSFSSKTLPLLANGQGSESNIDTGNPIDSSQVVHHYWRRFDDSFMRPMFGGRGFVPVVPGSPEEGSSLH
ncbi:monovalent cation:H+ antiporter, CPA1 (nhx1) [Stylosanthes scabra]|uniref:Sodium/hydrogen exchanger n=1 Tax=Stylosanthes scabra TaxID=79078 RepID=A0ABU6S6T8_9FABA|nr:monovalent cation:H+ antiporter, CPA1 (nhx1) [Stylosanthes scabra]